MKKELKRQIKEDEVLSGAEHAMAWVQRNQRTARIGAIALFAIVLGGWAWSAWQASRARAAEAAFGDAMELFGAPLQSELPAGEKPAVEAFATAEEKYRKAAAVFDGVERGWGSLPQGVRARYFGALCRIETKDYAAAEKSLQDVAARTSMPLESALARVALADLQQRKGDADKALAAYRTLADEATLAVPRDYVLMNLATLLEDGRRFDEARAAYQRIVDEFPGSGYQNEASRRAEHLKSAGKPS